MDPDPHYLVFFLNAYNGVFITKAILLLFLLGCSAMISAAEVALFGLSQTNVNEMQDNGTARGRIVAKLLNRPKKLLATILITNNAINIGIVLLFSSLGDVIFSQIDQTLFGVVSVRFVVELIVATFLILMFGEILPKIYANRNRVNFSLFMAYPLKFLNALFTPLSSPMRSGTIFLEEKLGRQKSNLSVDHLSQALELASEGDTTKEEQKILEGIVTFGNTDTKQVMRPRIDIFALDEEMKFPEVLEEIKKMDIPGFRFLPKIWTMFLEYSMLKICFLI